MAEAQDDAPEAPRTGRRTAARITGRGLIALFSAVVLGTTATGWFLLDRLDDVSSSTVLAEPAAPDEAEPPPPRDDGALDLLLVGSDSRTDAHGNPLPESVLRELRTESSPGLNTDTLVVVRVPHDGAAPTAVSIPRDTYTEVPGGRPEKINAVYGLAKAAAAREEGADEAGSRLAGQRALVRTVQRLTGVRIDRYAEINLLGFYEITEAVGGVRVCLRQATSDPDSGADFAAGPQRIAGGDALAFVRQRGGLPRGDLDRIVRQQVFMASLAGEVFSSGTLTDPARLNGLIAALRRSVVLDQDWDVMAFAQRMRELAAGGVSFVTLPLTGVGLRDDRDRSIVTVDPPAVRDFFAGLVAPPPPGLAPAAPLRLDATAQPPPITSDGVPCVN
ncbi:LCP family protein [Saccharopolyspora cebuensis]|uniref:LCP family protein n=1 Tax=Saccharopolyspora cebuensis TaxID=418759 RepID=A0ABV4CQ56_9PSEU